MIIKDKQTGQEYDPIIEWEKIANSPEYLAMLQRMKNEEGKGWPARNKD